MKRFNISLVIPSLFKPIIILVKSLQICFSLHPLNSKTVQIYKEPIKIYDRSGEPNFYSEIGDDPESPLFIGPLTGYNKPKYLLDKAMIVRAFCKNDEGQSKIISHSYFITSGNLKQYKN